MRLAQTCYYSIDRNLPYYTTGILYEVRGHINMPVVQHGSISAGRSWERGQPRLVTTQQTGIYPNFFTTQPVYCTRSEGTNMPVVQHRRIMWAHKCVCHMQRVKTFGHIQMQQELCVWTRLLFKDFKCTIFTGITLSLTTCTHRLKHFQVATCLPACH